MRAKEFIIESYQPPSLSVGDKILKGKFKNSPAEIKGFKKDKHNQPVLKTNKGEVQLFKPRISKLMPEGVAEGSEQDYLSQIPNLSWKPVSRSVWNTIQDEGLDEEQDTPSHSDWVMASLSIDAKDAQALMAFENDAIEDFNRFDIHLKSRYPGLTDLIDYDRGTVTIVKPINKQGVSEGKQPGKSVTDAIQKILPITQEIWFHGSRAIGKHRRNSDTDILVVVPDDVVGDQYLAVVRILQKLSSHFDNYDIQPTKLGTNIHRIAQEEGRLLWSNKQGVAEGSENNRISFQVQKGKNKFATTLSIGNNPVGVYQYDANTGRSIAEVYPEFKGKGLGKLLVLHAIYTAAKLGLDFQEDESRTSEYDNVLDSLSSNGYIVDDDGYWYVTGEGEQFLKQSLKQGVAEGLNEFAPGEGGFGPFKVYISNEFIEEFSTFDQAKEEINFLRTADPKSFDADWKIIDGTGKTVWQHDPGEAIDAMRMRRKIQFNKPDDNGVAEEVNPDVTSDEYFIEPTENVRMGDFVFNARTFSGGLGDPNARGLQIRAYDPKNLKGSIGSADFIVKKDKKGNTWLESDDTEVDELYRGKGVAAMMYAFAKSLGNDIKDSPYKSKAGSDMWKKWGSDAKHLVGQPGVPEDLTETTSQLGPQLYTPHPKNLDESMKPENVLWTSTASGNNNGYTSAWVRWAKNEMPGWIGHSGFLYDVSPSARILTINSDRDAMRVAKEYGLRTTDIMDLFRYMPWNKIAKDYDAIHHVPSNRGSDIFMYAWDVESTAWFNTKMLLNKRKVPIVASKQGMAE